MQCSSSKKYVIVLACGSGNRMGTTTPKQFLLLDDKPIIFHTIEKIYSFDTSYNIIAVINKEHESLWNENKLKYSFNVPLRIAFGGNERFFSVKNGLNAIEDNDGLVAVHDGVRPFVTKRMFEESFSVSQKLGNAVCAVQSTDSVRIMTESGNKAIERKNVFLIQTPQTFRLNILRNAYKQPFDERFTDDASVVEAMGEKINIINGVKENIKITYPSDLLIARQLFKSEKQAVISLK